MKRYIRFMLAVSAMFALTALTTSAAFAIKGEWDFGSNVEKIDLTGSQAEENVFTFNGGTVKCKEASFVATATGTPSATVVGGPKEHFYSHTATVHPKYGNCTGFGQAATVTTEEGPNSCNYALTATGTETGTIQTGCSSKFEFQITIGPLVCTIRWGAQTPINNKIDFSEAGAGSLRDLLIKWTIGPEKVVEGEETGFTYTSSGGVCGKSGKNGKYRGTTTVKAYVDGVEHKEANQVALFTAETVE